MAYIGFRLLFGLVFLTVRWFLSIYRLAESRDRFDDFLSFLWIYRFHFGRLWSVYVTIAQKDLLLPFRRRNIPSLCNKYRSRLNNLPGCHGIKQLVLGSSVRSRLWAGVGQCLLFSSSRILYEFGWSSERIFKSQNMSTLFQISPRWQTRAVCVTSLPEHIVIENIASGFRWLKHIPKWAKIK